MVLAASVFRSVDPARRRRAALALGVYLFSVAVFFVFADRSTLTQHTPYNHFALLADAWLHGRLDLGGPPPAYAGNNDFARFDGKTFIVFPPFPALLLLPVVKLAGSAENVRDGQFFLWCAGLAPAFLFLVFEKLRRLGRATTSERQNLALALLFAFGSVYFFSAEQGTVWYAAHVIGAALAALYVLFALDAERPLWAGIALALGAATRSPLLFAVPLFVIETLRVSSGGELASLREPRAFWSGLDKPRALGSLALFAAPIVVVLGVLAWHNHARFGDASEVGYQYLNVAWQARMRRWGLFSYHYLAKNLGVALTDLPWYQPSGEPAPFQINAHGLPLWFTTPMYLWLLWPRRTAAPHAALWLTVLGVALPSLLYQNTGWIQFGYRFSNDYAVFLFALIAIGGFRFGRWFEAAVLWAISVNAFGAYTFQRRGYERFYFVDGSQRVLYQPD